MSSALLGSIPSPDSGVVHLGPVPLHMYGLMIAIGVLVAPNDPEPIEATAIEGADEVASLPAASR